MAETPARKRLVNTFDRMEFSTVGLASTVRASPFVLHFGGYEVGKVHKQVLRVYNTADYSHRVHVVPPGTPFFKSHVDKKHGVIAPGMCLDVAVEFCPKEWRYYYDCIRVHSEEENLLVPIHAYPTMNEAKFPSAIDFGRCEVGRRARRTVTLGCNVPIQFEFMIETPGPADEFHIEPVAGVIPANGTVDIDVWFHPEKMVTSTAEIQVHVSEFNSKPVVCKLTGSGFPVHSKRYEADETEPPRGRATFDLEASLKKPSSWEREKLARRAAAGGALGSTGKFIPPEHDVELEGMQIPPLAKLFTSSGVNNVLMQEPGKLTTRNVKEAITNRREIQFQEAQMAAAAAQAAIHDGLDPFDDLTISGPQKEILFQRATEEAMRLEHVKEIKAVVALGETVMSAEEIEGIRRARAEQELRLEEAEHSKALSRAQTEYHAEPYPYELSGEDPVAAYRPTFQKRLSDDWPVRGQAVELFIQVVRKAILYNRLQKRLGRIKQLLEGVGYDRRKLAEYVAEEFSGSSGGGSVQNEKGKALWKAPPVPKPHQVLTNPFPVYCASDFVVYKPVKVNEVVLQETQVAPLKLQKPMMYKILGYKEMEFEKLSSYVPTMEDAELLEGAREEYDWRCGVPNVDIYDVPAPADVFGDDARPAFLDPDEAAPFPRGMERYPAPDQRWAHKVYLPNLPNSRYDMDLLGADCFRKIAEDRPKDPPFFRERVGEMTVRAISESDEHSQTLSKLWTRSYNHRYEGGGSYGDSHSNFRPNLLAGPAKVDDEDSDEEVVELEKQRKLASMPDPRQIRAELVPAEWKPGATEEGAAEEEGAEGADENEKEEEEEGAGPLWMMAGGWVHPREAALDKLEQHARDNRLERLAAVDGSVKAMNATIQKKCLYGVQVRDAGEEYREDLFDSKDAEGAEKAFREMFEAMVRGED